MQRFAATPRTTAICSLRYSLLALEPARLNSPTSSFLPIVRQCCDDNGSLDGSSGSSGGNSKAGEGAEGAAETSADADAEADDFTQSGRRRVLVLPTMFPPTAAEAKAMRLERCVRIWPHLQDTGGFFVAVFEKRAADSASAGSKAGKSGKLSAASAAASAASAADSAALRAAMDLSDDEAPETRTESKGAAAPAAGKQAKGKTGKGKAESKDHAPKFTLDERCVLWPSWSFDSARPSLLLRWQTGVAAGEARAARHACALLLPA